LASEWIGSLAPHWRGKTTFACGPAEASAFGRGVNPCAALFGLIRASQKNGAVHRKLRPDDRNSRRCPSKIRTKMPNRLAWQRSRNSPDVRRSKRDYWSMAANCKSTARDAANRLPNTTNWNARSCERKDARADSDDRRSNPCDLSTNIRSRNAFCFEAPQLRFLAKDDRTGSNDLSQRCSETTHCIGPLKGLDLLVPSKVHFPSVSSVFTSSQFHDALQRP
jgi:hypothetical protein